MTWINPLPLTLVPTNDVDSWAAMAPETTGLPLAPHPGAFGVQRKHHVHEGVDLYGPEGMEVMAVEDGVVVAAIEFTGQGATPPSPWWLDTKALIVEGNSGVVVYGEIETLYDYWPGDLIRGGDVIGYLARVLVHDKGRPMTMLHLELHKPGTLDAFEWLDEKPVSLLDPTAFLLDMVSPNSHFNKYQHDAHINARGRDRIS